MPPWKDTQRPFSVGETMHTSGQVKRPDSYSKAHPLPTPRRPRFPNIKDLQDQAAALNVNDTTPVRVRFSLKLV
jgi:ubiquitin carboxyl-terminal hydrolase 8